MFYPKYKELPVFLLRGAALVGPGLVQVARRGQSQITWETRHETGMQGRGGTERGNLKTNRKFDNRNWKYNWE